VSDVATLKVTGNKPRLLEEGASPPPSVDQQQTAEELEIPHVYWTPDKAQHVVARICHAASKFYGPSVKAAPWELELIGEPAAAVMNDWMPLRAGASSDKTANLIALAVVTAIIVALRLPDILEVHGILKPWKPKGAQLEQDTTASSPSQPPVSNPTPAAPPPSVVNAGAGADTFEPQLVGVNGHASAGGERMKDQVFGQQTVGGSDFATPRD